MRWAGFEPASLATVELESTPLNRSGTNALIIILIILFISIFL